MIKKLLLSIAAVSLLHVSNKTIAQQFEWREMNSTFTAFAQLPGSPETILAGDNAGLIKKTTDKGNKWKMVSFVSENKINSIGFISSTTGFAACDRKGLILVTKDGGNTWERKQFMSRTNTTQPHEWTIKRIVPVDNQIVYLDFFSHPISNPSPKEALVSRDGGATFKLETTPGYVYHVAGDTLVAFGAEKDFFGLNKFTTYRSIDKGINWSIVASTPSGIVGNDMNFNGIQNAVFINSKTFFITANNTLASDRRLYKTTDGGLTFTTITKPGASSAKIEWLYFKDNNEAFAMVGASPSVYYTSNGGSSWTAGAGSSITVPAISLGDKTILANISGVSTITTDFGANWTNQSALPANLTSSGSPNIHFLDVMNDSTAIASVGSLIGGVYSGNQMVKTTNKGVTWNYLKNGANQNLNGASPKLFITDKKYFFLSSITGGNMTINYTTDGEQTSSAVFTGTWNEGSYIQEIKPIDWKNLITYNHTSFSIIHSSDSGKTWNRVNIVTPPAGNQGILYMATPSVSVWYALTTGNQVHKSTDQGANWTNVTGTMDLSPGGLRCNSGIFFTNDNTGYVYGCQGKLYETTDGGTSWQDIRSRIAASNIYNNNEVLTFKNSTTAYLAGPSSGITYTDDAGQNWKSYIGSQMNSVEKLVFKDSLRAGILSSYGGYAHYIGKQKFTTDTLQLSNVVTSLNDDLNNEHKSQISIYPNPAHDVVYVQTTNDNQLLSVSITDLSGAVLLTSTNSLLHIAQLEQGLYIVKALTAKGSLQQKLLIR